MRSRTPDQGRRAPVQAPGAESGIGGAAGVGSGWGTGVSLCFQYFAAVLRLLRERAGLTQDELGALMNYTGSAVSAVETCARPPTDEFSDAAEKALDAGGLLRSAIKYLRGGQCIEVAYDWHKSSYSDAGGGECVEVATTPTTVHIRDSKDPDGPRLHIAAIAWAEPRTGV